MQAHAIQSLASAGATVVGPWWAALIPVLPLAGVVLCTLCAMGRVKTKLPAWLSVGCLALSFVLTVAMYMGLPDGATQISTSFRWFDLSWGNKPGQHLVADFGFYIDSLTCLWMLFVTGL